MICFALLLLLLGIEKKYNQMVVVIFHRFCFFFTHIKIGMKKQIQKEFLFHSFIFNRKKKRESLIILIQKNHSATMFKDFIKIKKNSLSLSLYIYRVREIIRYGRFFVSFQYVFHWVSN